MSISNAGPFGHGLLSLIACKQALLTRSFYRRHHRFLRFIDTHQKWLLLHLIADTVASAGPSRGQKGAAANWIADRATELGIASRNTTLAFFGQLAAYGYIERHDCRADRRLKLVSLSADTAGILDDWAAMLIDSQDDAEDRPGGACWPLYLDIARGLLDQPAYINPPLDIRLTQEMRGGWLVMSDIVARIDLADADRERIPVQAFNTSDCAREHSLSKSTLYRLLRHAAEAGIMGGGAEAQIPTFWLSGYHFKQYCRWNGRLIEAVRSAFELNGSRHTAPANKMPEIQHHTVHEIRAPATSFL